MSVSLSQVMSFLHSRYVLGRQANTIKSYISALGKFLPPFEGVQLGQHKIIQTYLAGVRHLKPPKRVLVPQWDLQLVLDFLSGPPFEPIQSASLLDCTLKTVFLVAVASAARVSELTALDCGPTFTIIRQGFALLKHREGFRPKVPSSANVERSINLRALPGSKVCPVRALSHYLQLTSDLRRPPCTQLFVSFAKGKQGKPVLPTTVSAWVVRLIRSAYEAKGLPLPSIGAHSARKMATSTAWAQGASCEEICRAASWKDGQTFAQYYKLDMMPAHLPSISSRVLGSSASSQGPGDP